MVDLGRAFYFFVFKLLYIINFNQITLEIKYE